MAKLTKIGILSAAKIQGIIGAIMGFIIGFFVAIISLIIGTTSGPGFMAGIGILAIILFPILYGCIGFVMGAIGAALFNLIAEWIGGLEIEIKK